MSNQSVPDPVAIRNRLRVLEAELEADARLEHLRQRFGIEDGKPLSFPLASPILDREGGLAVRRVWVGEEDRTGYLLIEREDW
jgi:hypothetical protein